MINASQLTADCVDWIRDWFDKNGNAATPAVLGLSGGKDSTIAAALIAQAIGPQRVIGVAMPAHGQSLNDADAIAHYLKIRFLNIPIGNVSDAFNHMVSLDDGIPLSWSEQAEQNIPPRIRMTVLYAVAQTYGGRVVNTCNLSENWVGYATKYGDAAGDFSPLGQLTVTEILAMGDYLGLPKEWVHKTPDDGLPHSMSDEEKLGFRYAEVDLLIRGIITPQSPGDITPDKIERMLRWHNANLHKQLPMPHFIPSVQKEKKD